MTKDKKKRNDSAAQLSYMVKNLGTDSKCRQLKRERQKESRISWSIVASETSFWATMQRKCEETRTFWKSLKRKCRAIEGSKTKLLVSRKFRIFLFQEQRKKTPPPPSLPSHTHTIIAGFVGRQTRSDWLHMKKKLLSGTGTEGRNRTHTNRKKFLEGDAVSKAPGYRYV